MSPFDLAKSARDFYDHSLIRLQVYWSLHLSWRAIQLRRQQPHSMAPPLPQARLSRDIQANQDLCPVQLSYKPQNVVLRSPWLILSPQQARLATPQCDEFMVEPQ